jgi:hypothetical protein
LGSAEDEDSITCCLEPKPQRSQQCSGPLLEKREKWGTPSSFIQRFKANRAMIVPEKWATLSSCSTGTSYRGQTSATRHDRRGNPA